MLQVISQQRWVRVFWAYFALLLLIFALAYAHRIPVQIAAFPLYDKLGHAVLLGLAAYFGHRASGQRLVGRATLPLAALVVALFAVTDECLQSLSPYRTFDLLDIAADGVGIVLFLAVDWYAPTRRRR